MEVILIEDVSKLGKIGDLVRVAAGYARNFLLPKKLAIAASVNNKRRLEHEKRLAGFRQRKTLAQAEALAGRLRQVSLTLARKVGEQEKIFGSVTAHDIHAALEQEGIVVDRRKVVLDEPIKALGVYDVAVKIQEDITAIIKVWVVAET